jgi:integrase
MFRLVTLALNLPLRRGQLLAITPDALDLENGLLFAEASKGRDSRVIPLNSTAVTTLRLMREHGQLPFPLKDFRKRWFRALKAAKIEGYRFHDLRKEFASELIRKNVNPTIVQKLFAHSSLAITDIYMHAEMDQLKQAVNTLDDNVQELRGEQ